MKHRVLFFLCRHKTILKTRPPDLPSGAVTPHCLRWGFASHFADSSLQGPPEPLFLGCSSPIVAWTVLLPATPDGGLEGRAASGVSGPGVCIFRPPGDFLPPRLLAVALKHMVVHLSASPQAEQAQGLFPFVALLLLLPRRGQAVSFSGAGQLCSSLLVRVQGMPRRLLVWVWLQCYLLRALSRADTGSVWNAVSWRPPPGLLRSLCSGI